MNNCFDEGTFEFDETAFNRLAELLALYKGCTVHYSYRMPITGGAITKRTDGILAEVTNRRFLIETQWDMKCRWWKDIDEKDVLVVHQFNRPPLYIFFKDYANTTTSKNYNNLDTDMLMRDFRNYDKGKHVSYKHMTEDRKFIQVNGNLVYVDDVRFVIESDVNHCLYVFMFSEINPDTDEYKRTLVNGNVVTLDWSKFKQSDNDKKYVDTEPYMEFYQTLKPHMGKKVHYTYFKPHNGTMSSKPYCISGTLCNMDNVEGFDINAGTSSLPSLHRIYWKDITTSDNMLICSKNSEPRCARTKVQNLINFADFSSLTAEIPSYNWDIPKFYKALRAYIYDEIEYINPVYTLLGILRYINEDSMVIQQPNNCCHVVKLNYINPANDILKFKTYDGQIHNISRHWNEFKDTSYILIKLQPLCDETVDRCISNILNSKLTQQILKDQVMYAVLTNDFYAEANVDILKKYINFKVLGSPIKDNDDWYVKLQILGNIPVHTMDLLKSGNVRAIPHYVNKVGKAPYVESFKLITLE